MTSLLSARDPYPSYQALVLAFSHTGITWWDMNNADAVSDL
jgi:hypothetical protein